MTIDIRLEEKEQDIKKLELYRDLGQTELLTKYYDQTIEKLKGYHWYQSIREIEEEYKHDINVTDETTESRIEQFKKQHKLNIRK
jgi:hypothetical protein